MLRIFRATRADGTVVLTLEGQVRGQWVDELRRLCSGILLSLPPGLVLDLAQVSFIDANGLELLHQLSSRQVSLNNCSLFATQLLKTMEPKQ